MFEVAHLHEDALREYDELELCYLETGAKCMYHITSSHIFFFRFEQSSQILA